MHQTPKPINKSKMFVSLLLYMLNVIPHVIIVLEVQTYNNVKKKIIQTSCAALSVTALIGLVTLTFDISTCKCGSRATRVMGFLPANFQLTTLSSSRLRSGTGQTDGQTTAINA